MIKFSATICLLTLCCSLTGTLHAQSVKVPTDFGKLQTIKPHAPTVAGLLKFGDYPVAGANGIPDISIPLHDYSSGALEQNITLSYHSGGIKVKDRAGWVGLGWTLNVGGAITTQVNGFWDIYGYFFNTSPEAAFTVTAIRDAINSRLTSSNQDNRIDGWTLAEAALGNTTYGLNNFMPDYMPDYYAINAVGLPSSGFSFNSDWTPGLFDASSPLKVEVLATDNTTYWNGVAHTTRDWIDGFIVTNEEGTKYFFSGRQGPEGLAIEATFMYPELWQPGGTSSADGNPSILLPGIGWNRDTYAYPSAFYLTKILSATKKDSIVFEYETDVTIKDDIVSQSEYIASACVSNGLNTNIMHLETTTAKLKSITYKNGQIVFNRSVYAENEDSRLDNITISSLDRGVYVQKKKIIFSYDFYNNLDGTQTLKLLGVSVAGSDVTVDQKYTFDYNTTQLPGRLSTDQDHWGYYNHAQNPGTTNSHNVCGLCPRQSVTMLNGATYQIGSGSRVVNPAYTQAGILKSITYPTGGKTVFEFENHKKPDNTIVGGLRIARVLNYTDASATTAATITRYGYEGGYSLGYNDIDNSAYYRVIYIDCSYCVNSPTQVGALQLLSFSNANGIYENQSVLAYSKIIEYKDDPTIVAPTSLYRTEYEYNVATDMSRSAYFQNVPTDYQAHSPYQNFSPLRALLKTSYFNGNTLVRQTETVYNSPSLADDLGPGFLISPNNAYTNHFHVPGDLVQSDGSLGQYCSSGQTEIVHTDLSPNYLLMYYPVFRYQHLQKQTIERDYATPEILTKTVDFTYSSLTTHSDDPANASWHPFPVRIDETGSDGVKRSIVNRYPWDFPISSTGNAVYTQLWKLKITHRNAQVISSTSLVNDQAVGSVITEYNGDYPQTSHVLETDKALACSSCNNTIAQFFIIPSELATNTKPRVNFIYDINNGRLSQQQNTNDESTRFLWGYNDELVVASVTNATESEVGFIGYEFETTNNVVTTDAHTGKYSANIGLNQSTGTFQRYNLNVRSYVYSAWVRASGNGYIKMFDFYHTNTVQVRLPDTQGKWQYIEIVIDAAANANLSTLIYNDTGGDLWVDDVRFFPKGERMTTWTYEPFSKDITSTTNENNITTYYEYDPMMRLKVVRDYQKNIQKTFDYYYRNK